MKDSPVTTGGPVGPGWLVSLLGLPGSGKTTVAEWLSASLDAELVCEDYLGNPFLAESYAGRWQTRLPGQAWFLLSRLNQLAEAHWPAGAARVSDYAFGQDAVYAGIWLEGAEWDAYARLLARVESLVRPPSVLVHLDGPQDLLWQRIRQRGRDYEAFFTDEFLTRLAEGYDRVLTEAPCPVVRVDIGECDLREPGRQAWLTNEIRRALAG